MNISKGQAANKPAQEEARLHYSSPDFTILRPGRFVRCAVTNQPILLEELKYWSVIKQEAYASAEIAYHSERDYIR